MNTTIQKILNELSEAISAELAAANDREASRDQEISRLRDWIAVLLEGATEALEGGRKRQSPANDCDARAITRASAEKKRTPPLPDQTFFDALNHEWTTASKVRKGLNLCGIPVGEGTVYNRMRKLVADFPDEVEATDKPERWRRKLDTYFPGGANDFDAKVAGKRKRPSSKPRLRLVPTSNAAVVAVEVMGEAA